MPEDYYELLGIDRNATAEDIKKAYRKQSLKYHPDSYKGDKKEAEQLFHKVNAAYKVLSDPESKKQYDNPSHNDLFSSLFGDFFTGSFHGQSTAHRHRNRYSNNRSQANGNGFIKTDGHDLKFQLFLELEELYNKQLIKEINYEHKIKCTICKGCGIDDIKNMKTCPECNGTGSVRKEIRMGGYMYMSHDTICDNCSGTGRIIEEKHRCNTCHGKGTVIVTQNLQVNVPYGINHGGMFCLDDKGDEGLHGGKNGKLYIEILYKKHEGYIVDYNNNNLYKKMYYYPSQFIFGCKQSIILPNSEKIEINMASGWEPHQEIKIKNKGLPYGYSYKLTDLIIVPILKIHDTMTMDDELRKKYQEIYEIESIL